MSEQQVNPLSEVIRARITTEAEQWVRLPLLDGVRTGTLDPAIFRNYLEQDYAYLRYFARIYARLAASSIDDDDLEHFVGLAHGVLAVELGHHKSAASPFGCNFDEITAGAPLARYLAFYEEHALDRAATLIAMSPCIYGYGVALSLLRIDVADGPYRDWLDIYAGGDYTALMERHFAMVDDADITEERALAIIDRGLALEIEFWNQLPHEAEVAA